jgi:hypothetical protein
VIFYIGSVFISASTLLPYHILVIKFYSKISRDIRNCDTALQRKSHLCIPVLGTARPQSQFQHSCVCERFMYSQNRSTYILEQNRQIDCGNWDHGRAIPFLGIFVSNYWYWFFAAWSTMSLIPMTDFSGIFLYGRMRGNQKTLSE